MTGILMPTDRTVKQRALGFCRNPACREKDGREFHFPVEHDHFTCPKCGADSKPTVGLLVLTHLLIPHPQGPIRGLAGRWVIACDDARAYLATATNQEAATGDASVANCEGCLLTAKKLGIALPGPWGYQAKAA